MDKEQIDQINEKEERAYGITEGQRNLKDIRAFAADESGVGVIELVLILVVLIGLVIIFKKQINTLLENIFKQINSKSKEVY